MSHPNVKFRTVSWIGREKWYDPEQVILLRKLDERTRDGGLKR